MNHNLASARFPLLIIAGCTIVPAVAAAVMWLDSSRDPTAKVLLNVSCDPTRELWRDINQIFVAAQRKKGQEVSIRQSHGGSASQASAVINGLPADVVSLALWTDTDILRQYDLLAANWDARLPNRSIPYTSTIVFVVRRGNPKQIHDWPDLIRPGVEIIVPNPKTSGNGKLAFLGAWGSVKQRGGPDAEAESFVSEVFRHVPVMETGARGATTTFAQNGLGDVQLTWENEAHLEMREYGTQLEIIYPSTSIRAEPPVAVVDQVVNARGTRALADAYLESLFTPIIQNVIAKHYYRPVDPDVLAKHREQFPEIDMFPITAIAPGWQAAQDRFFSSGGVFDRIVQR